jgi:hypothetical protein
MASDDGFTRGRSEARRRVARTREAKRFGAWAPDVEINPERAEAMRSGTMSCEAGRGGAIRLAPDEGCDP